MKTSTALAAASFVLCFGLSEAQPVGKAPPRTFELPPYKVGVTPVGSVPEGTPFRFRPLPTGAGGISQQVCKLEVWPVPPGHGAVWIGGSDPTCAREETASLPTGSYSVKLGVGWQSGGQSHFATAETPYTVTGIEKLQMTKCAFLPAQPMAGIGARVSWEVRNLSPTPLGPFPVSIIVSHEAVDTFTVGTLQPGSSFSRTADFTPRAAGTFKTQCTVDPGNSVHEGAEFLKNNTMFGEIDVLPGGLMKPVIVLGTLHLSPNRWTQDYIVCNADLDASYRSEMAGCAWPCTGGLFDGMPSPDALGVAIARDGSGFAARCPGGLLSRVAINIGPADGVRNHWEDKTYSLKVKVTRGGSSAETSVPVRVPQYCGLISVPICVENEQPGR